MLSAGQRCMPYAEQDFMTRPSIMHFVEMKRTVSYTSQFRTFNSPAGGNTCTIGFMALVKYKSNIDWFRGVYTEKLGLNIVNFKILLFSWTWPFGVFNYWNFDEFRMTTLFILLCERISSVGFVYFYLEQVFNPTLCLKTGPMNLS